MGKQIINRVLIPYSIPPLVLTFLTLAFKKQNKRSKQYFTDMESLASLTLGSYIECSQVTSVLNQMI